MHKITKLHLQHVSMYAQNYNLISCTCVCTCKIWSYIWCWYVKVMHLKCESKTKFEACGLRNYFHAAAMLVREHKFRTPSLELTCRGTSSSGQKYISRSLGTQFGRCVIKAYHNRRKQRHEPIRIPGNYLLTCSKCGKNRTHARSD